MGKALKTAWVDGCEQYSNSDDGRRDLLLQCVGNAAVYRPTFCAFLFFAISSVSTYMSPVLNKEIWPAKIGAYFILLIISMFIHNSFYTGLYLLLVRIFAMIFILIQQVILIDVAYNWNEEWVERADLAESREWGSGKKWLHAIVACSVLLFIGSITGISLLYKYFLGCGENAAFITLTWIGILVMAGVQLTGEEGSLLTTACLSAYSVFLCYSIVSKNPNGVCNPTLGEEDVWGIAVGLFFTMISLAWTGWSWTASERLTEQGVEATRSLSSVDPARPDPNNLNLDVPFLADSERPTQGLVMENPTNVTDDFNSRMKSLWKLNVVLVLISCWVAASLTGWGMINGGVDEGGEHTAANPLVGKFNMGMIAISQNLAVLLYIWTLLAPRLFPDRVFS